MTTGTIHIIGGGIAGLAAAIAMARRGKDVVVYEKAPQFEEVGAGLQLGPNAVRALQALGAWDAVEPITYAPPAIRIHNAKTGKLLKKLDLGLNFEKRFGQPYRVAHRADLHTALLSAARALPNIEVKLGREVDATELTGEVIAADGIWSRTRQQLIPGSTPISTSDHIFRALVPCIDWSRDGMLDVNLWLYPGGHVVHYPVGRQHKLNLITVTQGKVPLEHFSLACDQLRSSLALTETWLEWPAAYVRPLSSWQKDNITLVGDAAHGTLPYLAQGAAMALEDAAALLDNADLNQRIQRCAKLNRETLKAGKIYHLSGLSSLRDVALLAMPKTMMLQRLSWIYCE